MERSDPAVHENSVTLTRTIDHIPTLDFKSMFVNDMINYTFAMFNRAAVKDQIIKRLKKLRKYMLKQFEDPKWTQEQKNAFFYDNLEFVQNVDVNKLYAYRNKEFENHFNYLDLLT